jgi:hypothetical protein
MANVFGILTTIVLLIAGLVAYKNQAAYELEIANRNKREAELVVNQARLKSAREALAATIAERTAVDAQVVKLTEDEGAQQKVNAQTKPDLEQKTAETASNKEKLDEIRAKTEKVGDLKELAPKMRALNAELEELAVLISNTEKKNEEHTVTNTEIESQVGSMKKRFETISNSQSLPILKTQIRAIYPAWGFVTLGTGNTGGVVPSSTLDVVRDGSIIAKLLVTAVERNSASASIIPDSIGKDVTLMIGDRVVPAQQASRN